MLRDDGRGGFYRHPEQARVVVPVATHCNTSPRASKFCFLKLPYVFGYVVPFSAISKKQNRKGSPQSLIYPYMGKFTSFVIKQFFAFGKVNQTLMRSRLRRFLPLSVALNQPKKNSLLFFVGEIKPRIKQKPNADLTFWDEAQKLFFKKLSKNRRNFSFSVV